MKRFAATLAVAVLAACGGDSTSQSIADSASLVNTMEQRPF